MEEKILFSVKCVLGKRIRTTKEYWLKIVQDKHPIMKDQEKMVQETLSNAEEVRQSKSDPNVYLYYRQQQNLFLCVVVKHLNGDGFVITTYLTENIKEGSQLWKRSG